MPTSRASAKSRSVVAPSRPAPTSRSETTGRIDDTLVLIERINTWFIEIHGTTGGIKYSTAEPKTLWTFRREGNTQAWTREDLGFGTPFKTITGGIFEPGFPDILQQMWAAFIAERAGQLNGRFGCATPAEAVASHEVFAAALESHKSGRAVDVG